MRYSYDRRAAGARVMVDVPETMRARQRFSMFPDITVAEFDSSVALYRVFDGEELARILKGGKITGGQYAAKPERAYGASWGHNITAIIRMGNQLRGKRLGEQIYLAKIDSIGLTFAHLDPGIEFDLSGPPKQPASFNPSVCNPGLGCSIMADAGDVDDWYEVRPDGQLERRTESELRASSL